MFFIVFINFLCISLFFFVFRLCVFDFFFRRNYSRTFLRHNYDKINQFQLIKVKIMIDLRFRSENSIYIHFVHKITFLSNFGVDEIFSKGRGLKTIRAGATNLVSKVARYLKVKTRRTARSENFALRIYRAKRRGGGLIQPPPHSYQG